MSKTPERLAYEAWYRKQLDSTMYCESTWRGWEAGRAALTQAADAGAAEPVGWITMWPAVGGGLRQVYTGGATKPSYGLGLDARLTITPVYAAPPAQQLQQAVARERERCAVICDELATLNRTSPTDSMWQWGECAAAIRQQGKAP